MQTLCRGEVLEIDTWVGASGKNGMRRDWLIRSEATGHVFARATRYVIISSDSVMTTSCLMRLLSLSDANWDM